MTLYFAYGSNMSRTPMRARCPTAREVGIATLAGHRLIITTDGYASVVPAPGGVVHGLLWRLAPRDIAALNAYESLDTGLYRIVTLPVRTEGRQVSAMVYVARTHTPGLPRPGYLEPVLAAARELAFPPDYVDALARWLPSAPRDRRAPDAGEVA
jgi:cation transport regulator ChaC